MKKTQTWSVYTQVNRDYVRYISGIMHERYDWIKEKGGEDEELRLACVRLADECHERWCSNEPDITVDKPFDAAKLIYDLINEYMRPQ